jgi:hypothetical protein
MNIQDIINNIAAGENLVAKEGLENVLSTKAFDALQDRKQEIASTLYAGQDETSEDDAKTEEDEEVTYAEGVEHDGEQLDELSKKTLSSYIKNAVERSQDDHREAGYGSASLSDRDGNNRTQKINRAVDKLAAKKTNK